MKCPPEQLKLHSKIVILKLIQEFAARPVWLAGPDQFLIMKTDRIGQFGVPVKGPPRAAEIAQRSCYSNKYFGLVSP